MQIKQIQIFKAKNRKRKMYHKCLSLIMLDSVIRVSIKYYHQVLLEKCKSEIKKTKMENLDDLIEIDDLNLSTPDDESDNETESDNESDRIC